MKYTLYVNSDNNIIMYIYENKKLTRKKREVQNNYTVYNDQLTIFSIY